MRYELIADFDRRWNARVNDEDFAAASRIESEAEFELTPEEFLEFCDPSEKTTNIYRPVYVPTPQEAEELAYDRRLAAQELADFEGGWLDDMDTISDLDF